MFSLYTTLIFFTLVIPAIAMPVIDLENQPDYSHYEHSIGGSKACPEGFMKDTLGDCKEKHSGPGMNGDDFDDIEDTPKPHHEPSTKGGSTVPELNQRILVSIVAFSLLVR